MPTSAAAQAPDLLRALIDQATGRAPAPAEDDGLTVVERFAIAHERDAATARWRELIPLAKPQPGEQYAFEVDLDKCTGCKSCVVACHNLNGLDDDELWRKVGLLDGGSVAMPYHQHVTTACHHCVEPACLEGCPVDAYVKEPITGIVRHLDDQCIGCQYCTLTCPYEVPRYSASRGIVRKCDMCHGRLAAGEPPACVQACPTEAIRITLVNQDAVIVDNEAGQFLPGTPDPGLTQPTTVYKSARPIPRNALPADYYAVAPAHPHPPLVAMLVLTQLSVGTFAVTELGRAISGAALAPLWRLHAAAALVLGLLALGASVLHLGRPHLAFRAVLGLRRSWLSREIVAFGGFAALASMHAALAWQGPTWASPALGAAVVGAGLIGVFTSTMVYVATGREAWRAHLVGARFFGTTAMLGVATTLALALIGAVLWPDDAVLGDAIVHDIAPILAGALIATSGLALLGEASLLLHARGRRHDALKRSALLQLGPLARVTVLRYVTGLAGGVVAPLLYLGLHRGPDIGVGFLVGLAIASLILATVGALLERHLFFVAAAAPRMPGEPR